jgi:hypothetical protein
LVAVDRMPVRGVDQRRRLPLREAIEDRKLLP